MYCRSTDFGAPSSPNNQPSRSNPTRQSRTQAPAQSNDGEMWRSSVALFFGFKWKSTAMAEPHQSTVDQRLMAIQTSSERLKPHHGRLSSNHQQSETSKGQRSPKSKQQIRPRVRGRQRPIVADPGQIQRHTRHTSISLSNRKPNKEAARWATSDQQFSDDDQRQCPTMKISEQPASRSSKVVDGEATSAADDHLDPIQSSIKPEAVEIKSNTPSGNNEQGRQPPMVGTAHQRPNTQAT
ncbi:hypothetical protein ACLOJK_035383 [Asimina triloba]